MKLRELFESSTVYQGDIQQNDYQLTTLEGVVPDGCTEVEGYFNIEKNWLTDFKGGPTRVGGYFYAEKNKLTSLEGAPETVGFSRQTSGSPGSVVVFDIAGNSNLKSLKGGPKKVNGKYYARRCGLTSLEGVASEIKGELDLSHNALTSLQGIHKLFKGGSLDGVISLDWCPIKSHILGLMLIPKLRGAYNESGGANPNDFSKAIVIVDKHLKSKERDVIDCQQELIEAGLKEFAQL